MSDLADLCSMGGAGLRLPLANAGELECLEVVRHVPGKRLVCRGIWNGQAVYAKLFMGPGAVRYAARDARGARALMAHGIATPPLLHTGSLEKNTGQILIYAAIPEGCDAEQAWATADEEQRQQLATALVDTVARHHAAGLIQTDLYLRNFLCTGNAIHTLDGDGIRIHSAPIPWPRALPNLALLLSKFDVETDDRIPALLDVYAARRGWQATAGMAAALRAKTAATRITVARQYAYRKVLRDCTEVQVTRNFECFLAVRRDRRGGMLDRILENPDAWLESGTCLRLKNGNTCTIGCVEADGRSIVIKRYNIKGVRHGLSRLMRRSRASISWSNAHLLRMLGIPTATPLALMERRWGPLRRTSYFVAEYVEGPDLTQVFADPARTESEKRAIATRVATLLFKMYRLGICHGDLKADNLKLVGNTLLLLDLDALRLHGHGKWFERQHARDLKRLLKNWAQDCGTQRLLVEQLRAAYGALPVLRLAGITER
jgi:tRNA A-37 threonylcarbamoyl transferase component Bud32